MLDATSSTARRVTTDDDLEELVAAILDPERARPVIAVTTKPDADGPFVDADALAGRVGELADVWLIVEPEHAWGLTDELPPKIDVYGGAVRAWTTLAADDEEPYPSDHPQWTVYTKEDGPATIDKIATYLELTSSQSLPAFGETAKAIVTKVNESAAELVLTTGQPAMVSIGHMLQHGEVYHAADVVQEGQEVTVRVGSWNPQAGKLSVTMREFAPDPWERLAEVYEPGMIIEGGITGLTAFGAFVEILPGVEGLLHLSKISNEFVNNVEDYVQEGERITVVLLDIDVHGRKAPVSLRDLPRNATPEPPAPILPGGPPWLPTPGAGGSADAAPAAASESTTDADATSESAAEGSHAASASTTDANVAPAWGDAAPRAAAAPALPAEPTPIPAGAPAYAAQLQALVAEIAGHGAAADAELAGVVREALERGIATFDAHLDDATDSADEPAEPIAALRGAASDLIDALRDADPSDD